MGRQPVGGRVEQAGSGQPAERRLGLGVIQIKRAQALKVTGLGAFQGGVELQQDLPGAIHKANPQEIPELMGSEGCGLSGIEVSRNDPFSVFSQGISPGSQFAREFWLPAPTSS